MTGSGHNSLRTCREPSAPGLLAWEVERLDRVAEVLRLDAGVLCALHCAARTTIVDPLVERDDGSLMVPKGFRVQHSNALGPAKGGTRTGRASTSTTCALAGASTSSRRR